MEKMNFCGSLCSLLEYLFKKNNSPQIIHAYHMTMTTSGQFYSWLDNYKTNVCLHFTQYMWMSPHVIGYKKTWYPPDVRKWLEMFTKLFLSNIIMVKVMYNDQLVYKVVIWAFFGISLWKEKVALIISKW